MIEKDSSGDILGEKKEETPDNVNDSRSVDTLLPPPGIPVKKKTKKTEKIFQHRDAQEGAGTRTEAKWL